MQAITILRTVAAAALLAGAASSAAAATDPSSRPALAWDCARPGAPTYAEVRDTFGVHDFHRAHRASLHLREVVKRACADGAASLLLVQRAAAGTPRFVAHRND